MSQTIFIHKLIYLIQKRDHGAIHQIIRLEKLIIKQTEALIIF